MQRRQAIAGLIGAPAMLASARSWSAAPSSRRLGDGIGLNVKFGQGQSLDELPMLLDLGVRWVRDHLPWRLAEPRAGQRDAGPPAWRRRLDYYRAHDIGLVCLLGLSNEQAYPPTNTDRFRPIDPEAFAAHALATARELRAAGLRFVLEIGNEPHNGVLHQMLGGDWAGRPPAPWLDHYVRMVQAAVAQVKVFDPTVPVLADDDLWVTHHRYLDAGLPAALDGFAVHPYVNGGPERTIDPQADWMRAHRIADDDRTLASAVRRLREHGEQALGHRPQVWFTEWGWPVGTPAPKFIDEGLQAARLPRAFIVAEAAGVEALCWYSSHDAGEGSFGLLHGRGQRRPAYSSLRTLNRELGDWQWAAQVIGADHPTTGLQAHLFRRGEQAKLALWNADEREQVVSLSGPLRRWRGVNGLGQAAEPRGIVGGSAEWRVGALPLYLAGDADALAGKGCAAHVH